MPGKQAVAIASPSAARARLRKGWLTLHRWLGLSLGLVLLLAALTGSALLIADPVDEARNPHLFHAGDAASVDYQAVVARLRSEVGPEAALILRPPREPGESFQAIVRGEWNGTFYLHPASADMLGSRGEREGLVHFLFTLHSSLFVGNTGKLVLTAAALAYVVMLATGIYLWWPARWARALSIRRDAGGLRLLFDWHRVSGAVFGLLVLVSVASGAYMAWPPLAKSVTALSGMRPVTPPTVAGGPPHADGVAHAVEQARALFPEAEVGYVQVPGAAAMPIRVRLKLPDDPHPNGLTSVWLHPDTAEILQVNRWSALDPGTRAYAYIYPLHTGELWGLPWTILTFLTGIILAAYGMTGTVLWWRRRR